MLWIFNHCSGTAYHILCIYKQTACAWSFHSTVRLKEYIIMNALSQLVGIKHDRKRTIILQFYLHISSEYASLHSRNRLFAFADAVLIQLVSHIRLSCLHKRRTVALFTVCIQSKLRYQKQFSVYIIYR